MNDDTRAHILEDNRCTDSDWNGIGDWLVQGAQILATLLSATRLGFSWIH